MWRLVADPKRGRLLAIFSYGEETRLATMPEAVLRAGRLDAALVGEPTNLQFAIAQRGLMMVDLIAHGVQRHAGYGGDGAPNAIGELARDLVRLDHIVAERNHPVLGATIVTPTMLEGGVSRNVTPPMARAVLDVRSTPAWTHDELEDALRKRLSMRSRRDVEAACAMRNTGQLTVARRGARRSRQAPICTVRRPARIGASCAIWTQSRSAPGRRAARTRPTRRSTSPR